MVVALYRITIEATKKIASLAKNDSALIKKSDKSAVFAFLSAKKSCH